MGQRENGARGPSRALHAAAWDQAQRIAHQRKVTRYDAGKRTVRLVRADQLSVGDTIHYGGRRETITVITPMAADRRGIRTKYTLNDTGYLMHDDTMVRVEIG